MIAQVYFNQGRWVADCPYQWCNSAETLGKGLDMDKFSCTECDTQARPEWPSDWFDIEAVLELRPSPATRNWFPKDHPLALASNTPHGQTVDELIDENLAYGVPTRRSR